MSVAVSVLVPIYNVERYLRQCLDSLVSQTLADLEIICINDGSTDGSKAIIDEYAAQHANIRVIDKPNSGYGHSMNCGLDAARGEYVGIVESDDFADKRMFKKLYCAAKKHDLDVAKASFYEYSEAGKSLCRPYSGLPCSRVFDPVDEPGVFNTIPAIWSGLYRRSMLVENGVRFRETPGASFQDTGFAYKVWAAARRCMLLRRGYLHYRVDNVGSSVKTSDKVYVVCDEHASIAEFLQTLPAERAREVAKAIQPAKFGNYRWNYNRILPEEHLAFASRIVGEFRAAQSEGLLVEASFDPKVWRLLQSLLADPEAFCAAYPDEIPWVL